MKVYLGTLFLVFPFLAFAQDEATVLSLDNGSEVILENHTQEPNSYKEHSLIEYLPDINHYVLKVQYYEGASYLLVSKANGLQATTIGEPHISPDKKRIVSTSGAIAYTHGGVMVHKLTPDGLKQEYFLREDGRYRFLKWVSATEFVLKRSNMFDSFCDEQSCWEPETFVLGDSGWSPKKNLSHDEKAP